MWGLNRANWDPGTGHSGAKWVINLPQLYFNSHTWVWRISSLTSSKVFKKCLKEEVNAVESYFTNGLPWQRHIWHRTFHSSNWIPPYNHGSSWILSSCKAGRRQGGAHKSSGRWQIWTNRQWAPTLQGVHAICPSPNKPTFWWCPEYIAYFNRQDLVQRLAHNLFWEQMPSHTKFFVYLSFVRILFVFLSHPQCSAPWPSCCQLRSVRRQSCQDGRRSRKARTYH